MDKERKEDKTIEIATQIIVADVINGHRKYWIDDLEENRVDSIIEKAVDIAQKLLTKVSVGK